jgi:uncharacterized RDD family membrane protein YckC
MGRQQGQMSRKPVGIDTSMIAPISARTFAYMIDIAVLVGIFIVESMAGYDGLAVFFVTMQGYFLISELAFRKSIGKRILGLEVVSEDLTQASIGQILGRAFLRPIDEFFFSLIGIVSISTSDENKRLGDRVAGTIVVQW